MNSFFIENKYIIATVLIIVVIVYLFSNRKIRPVQGAVISSKFGYRIHPITGVYQLHNGIDLSAKQGTPIKAIASGLVEYSTYDNLNGYVVKLKHLRYSTSYGHMLQTPEVKKGELVHKGQIIGYTGSTGQSTGPHVHFMIYDKNGTPIDPLNQTHIFEA